MTDIRQGPQPDIYARFSQAYDRGRAQAQENGLAKLSQQYFQQGSSPDLLGQVAALGGDAFALQKHDQDSQQAQAQETGRFAQMFLALPPEQKAQAYPALVAKVNALKLPHPPIPEQYNPQFDAGIAKFAEALGGGNGQAMGVQSSFIDAQGNRVAIMRDGTTQVLGQNAPNNQIIEGAGGFYGVNKGNLQAAPVMVGGSPQAAPQAPQNAFTLDDAALQSLSSIPPQERAAALQAMMTGGDFHVGQNGQPVQGLSPGAQLQPKPAAPKSGPAPTELERRVALARQMGASEDQIRAMVIGGGQTGNAQTVKTSQATSAKLAQFDTVQRGLDRLEKASQAIAGNKVFDGGPLDQYALKYTEQGQEMQQAGAALMPILTALTRVPGVGAQSDLEARLAQLQLPSPEFPPEVNKRAVEALRGYMADLKRAYESVQAKPAGQPAAPKGGWSIQAVP